MNRRLGWLLTPLLIVSACKQKAPENPTPTVETVGSIGLIEFDSPKGTFSCRAPGDWKISDKSKESEDVSFVGPAKNGLTYINILQYRKGDQWSDANKYADSFWEITPNHEQPALEKKKIGGKEVITFHFVKPFRKLHSSKVEYMQRLDYALIPCKGGFYELWHSAPADSYKETLPVFDAVVRSFKPKS